MAQKEKELLLKDICARLPYGVKAHGPNETDDTIWTLDYDSNINVLVYVGWRPYLRPMSSMTVDEKTERLHLTKEVKKYLWIDKLLDFYLSHHLDYRGLIPMGLALEAPEGMYKTE